MRRPLLSLALAGAVLLAACGSSGSTAATPTTTTKPAGTPTERHLGELALLRAADAPGFQKVAPQQSLLTDLAGPATTVKACKDYLAGLRRRVLTGRSAGLQRGTTVVDSSIGVFRDVAAAQAELALYRAASMAGCLKGVLAPPKTLIDVTPITIDPPLGDESVAYRVTPTGQPDATNGIDVIIVRAGRVLIGVNVTGTGADASEVERTAIAQAVDRVRADGA